MSDKYALVGAQKGRREGVVGISIGLLWPDPNKPLWMHLEATCYQCLFGIFWLNEVSTDGNPYLSVGIYFGPFIIRWTKSK